MPEVILAETSTPSLSNDLAILQRLHSALSSSRIALCGPHASEYSQEIMEKYDFIDFILRGEYEFLAKKLVNSLEGELPLEEIDGIAFRKDSDITVDHIKPRSKYPELALEIENLRVLCRSCNSKKGGKEFEELVAV